MPVLRRPSRYTALVAMLLLGLPVFLLNLWVVNKGPVIDVLTGTRLWAFGGVVAWVLVTVRWLLRARWAGLWSLLALSATLLGANTYLLITTRNYALAFYALFLLILSGLYAMAVFRNLGEAYYHSGRTWFEGLPRFIPGLEVEVRGGSSEERLRARLSRLATEGCYAYPRSPGDRWAGVPDSVSMKLGDLAVECAVELVSASHDGRGLRFLFSSADQEKDVRDFIDRARSAGYVP